MYSHHMNHVTSLNALLTFKQLTLKQVSALITATTKSNISLSHRHSLNIVKL